MSQQVWNELLKLFASTKRATFYEKMYFCGKKWLFEHFFANSKMKMASLKQLFSTLLNKLLHKITCFIEAIFILALPKKCSKITQNVAFEVWHFPPIFVLLKLTCLVTLFDRKLQVFKNSPKWTIFGIFNSLLSTQNVDVARFACNVE